MEEIRASIRRSVAENDWPAGRPANPGAGKGAGRTLVKAEVPQVEITRYAIDLRSLSHGTGSFLRTRLRYEPMPSSLAAKVIAEHHDE